MEKVDLDPIRLKNSPQWRELWQLDADLVFLNHGSFGATPRPVLDRQLHYRDMMEADPVRFFGHRLEPLLDVARARLAAFLEADPDGLALVANATTGLNTALRCLDLAPGDQLLVTDHTYNATRNAAAEVAIDHGAELVTASIPFPVRGPEQVVESVLARVTDRTRAAVVDHVTSATGLVLPIHRLVAGLQAAGVFTLVDGAHAPGMVPVDIVSIGADCYVGNCHKWMCAPKGAAFLAVATQHRHRMRPLVLSHGATAPTDRRSRFRLEFDWTGTTDPSAALCIPDAIDLLDSAIAGGWPQLRRRNRQLALAARRLLCAAVGVEPPCPDSMIGSLAAIPLPSLPHDEVVPIQREDPLQTRLYDVHRIQVPVYTWPPIGRRLLRISAHLYNDLDQYRRLAEALRREGLAP